MSQASDRARDRDGAAPVVAVLVVVSVMVLEPVVGFGLNDAVTPVGRPEADKLTLLVKPLCGVTVTLLVPLAPCAMLTLLGDAERGQFPTTVTASVIVVEFVRLPEVPVTVRVTCSSGSRGRGRQGQNARSCSRIRAERRGYSGR